MSETLGQPEARAPELKEMLSDAKERIEIAEINLERAQKAKLEAFSDYDKLLRESLRGQQILFTGCIETGAVRGMDGTEWDRRSEYYRDQSAHVWQINFTEDRFGNNVSQAYLRLSGGKNDGWEVSVHLEKIEWSIMEEKE